MIGSDLPAFFDFTFTRYLYYNCHFLHQTHFYKSFNLLTSGKYWWFWIHANNAVVLLFLAMALLDALCGHHPAVLAGLAFLFSVGFLLQILVIMPFLVWSSRPKNLIVGSTNFFWGSSMTWSNWHMFAVLQSLEKCVFFYASINSIHVICGPHLPQQKYLFWPFMSRFSASKSSCLSEREPLIMHCAYCCFSRDVLCTITGGRCSLVKILF